MIIRNAWMTVLAITLLLSCKKTETPVNNTPAAASTQLNVAYGGDPLQQMDIYLPAGRTTSTTKVMVLVHGGAWFGGNKADFAPFLDSLKARLPGYAIFNINYRLSAAPNNLFPTQELDVKAAVEAIYNKRGEYLVSDKFTMLGFSAGAHLSLLQAYKNASPVQIKAVVDFFGPTDLTDLYNNPGVVPQSNIALIIGATPTSNPSLYQQSSPLTFATDSSAVPTIIFQGSADPLVNPLRQSKALRDRLQIAGVPVSYTEYAGKGHGDDWDPATFTNAYDKITLFLQQYNP